MLGPGWAVRWSQLLVLRPWASASSGRLRKPLLMHYPCQGLSKVPALRTTPAQGTLNGFAVPRGKGLTQLRGYRGGWCKVREGDKRRPPEVWP